MDLNISRLLGIEGFRRNKEDGKLGGVCAGIADVYQIDVLKVRLAFLILSAIPGGGLVLLYLFLWLIVPKK